MGLLAHGQAWKGSARARSAKWDGVSDGGEAGHSGGGNA